MNYMFVVGRTSHTTHTEGNCITAHREHHSKKEGLTWGELAVQLFVIRFFRIMQFICI